MVDSHATKNTYVLSIRLFLSHMTFNREACEKLLPDNDNIDLFSLLKYLRMLVELMLKVMHRS